MSKPEARPEGLVWKKQKSHKGAEYQIGYPPPPSPPTGSIAVNWPVDTSGETTPDVLAATGIRSYSLQGGGHFFTFELDFNTANSWNYTFTDQSGDTYSCDCVLTGSHWIDYNSRLANIVEVSWSYTQY
jgi:hypothetical protein